VKNIRVNALAPGAISTRAASGIMGFQDILKTAQAKAPLHRVIDLDNIGNMAAFLVSDMAKNITGGVHVIDAGYEIID
jgi:enoyl-[acyl-carrier protein] reductase I